MGKLAMAVAVVLLTAGTLVAQVAIGDNIKLNATGDVSATYDSTWGNLLQSSHGLGFGLAGALGGYYYSPNFLSFNIDPYFNQSRTNSTFQSLTNASGVSLSSGIFSGSHFPGSFRFTKSYNSQGRFGLPGLPDYTTRGNNESFGLTWSELLPKLPRVTAGFQMGNDNYSLLGTNGEGANRFRTLFLTSSYDLAGFQLSGGVSGSASHAEIPTLFTGGNTQTTDSRTRTFNVGVSHDLPWSGSFSSSYNRSYQNSEYLGYGFDGTIDTWVSNAGFHPMQKLSMSLGADYSDSLSGSLLQAIAGPQPGAGAIEPGASSILQNLETKSHTWDLDFRADYSLAANLMATGDVRRRQQYFAGLEYASTSYGSGLSYNRRISQGAIGAGLNVIGTHVDTTGQGTVGLNTSANANRRFGAWTLSGNFIYGQNIQTLLISYLTSYYTVSGSVSRRLGPLFWNFTGSSFRTLLTAQKGSNSSGESYSTTLGTGKLNLGAGYSRSRGTSLATSTGLVPSLVPPVIPGSLLILYGGKSYSFSLSGSPVRKLTFTASYVKATSDSRDQGVFSWNKMDQENAYVQYQFRQIGLRAGYTRLLQGFSASGTPPANVNSFSVGLYRWFNFF